MKYDRKRGCNNVPFGVNIFITEKCPLKCPMCFQPYSEKAELELNAVYAYLDELSSLGTKYVQFSGGEPLSYIQLPQVILYAKEKGLTTRISTSGVGLTNQMAEQLKKVGLDYCHLSLNGSKAHIHELVRSGFNETMRALDILSNTYIPVSINWVANHSNVLDLPNLISLAKSYNVKYINLLSNKKNNSGKMLFPLSCEDLYSLKQYWHEYADYLVIESCFYQLMNLIKGNKAKSIEQGCRAGRFYMAISARNEFSPCQHLSTSQKSVISIYEYWNNDAELISMRQMLKLNQQAGCQSSICKEYCTSCLNEMFDTNLESNAHNCL